MLLDSLALTEVPVEYLFLPLEDLPNTLKTHNNTQKKCNLHL